MKLTVMKNAPINNLYKAVYSVNIKMSDLKSMQQIAF